MKQFSKSNYTDFLIRVAAKRMAIQKQRPAIVQLKSTNGNKGCFVAYPCGTTRFISNSWYVDIDTDQL